jgi:outer membrane protein
MNTVKGIVLAISAALLAVPMAASAYNAGDKLVKFGAASVNPESLSDDIDQAPGEAVTADDEVQFGISGTYMLSSKVGVELLAASPFSHDITAKGGALDGADIGSIKHLPPTLSAQYYFLGSQSKFKPYVGAGLTYTTFFSEDIGSGAKGLGYDDIELDDSFGLSAQIGFDYQVSDKWLLNASAMYADIDTTATLKGDDVANLTVDYDLDPVVYRLNLGYKF